MKKRKSSPRSNPKILTKEQRALIKRAKRLRKWDEFIAEALPPRIPRKEHRSLVRKRKRAGKQFARKVDSHSVRWIGGVLHYNRRDAIVQSYVATLMPKPGSWPIGMEAWQGKDARFKKYIFKIAPPRG